MGVDLMRTKGGRVPVQATLFLPAPALEQALNSQDAGRDHFVSTGLAAALDSITIKPGTFSKTVSATANSKVATFFVITRK